MAGRDGGLRPKTAPDAGAPLGSGAGEADASWVFEPGRVLAGRYRIDGVLGRGGMGVVTAGLQLDLERPVAIKLLRRSLAQNARPTQRFAREAKAIAKMRSEHVVRVFDVGEEEGVPFIVMERLNGNDLAAELAHGPLPVAVAIGYVLQACEAIAEAHSRGIIHRDLKPSNLFLAEGFAGRRTLKVLDFGVSKWLGPAPDLNTPLATSEGSFVGTPAYVSPEQLTRPESVDQRTDVWALGVVLYQCLSARLPFEADSVPRLCAEVLTAEPSPLASALSVPAGLERVILRCLHKERDQRYADVLELAHALRPFAPGNALHLVDSIESLLNGTSAGERPSSQVPAPNPDGMSTPATTLTFSQDPERREGTKTSSTPRGHKRLRVAALSIAVGALALWGVFARRSARVLEPATESEHAAAPTSRTKLSEPALSSGATPPAPGTTAVTSDALPAPKPPTARAAGKPAARPLSVNGLGKTAERHPSTPHRPEAGPVPSSAAVPQSPEPITAPSATTSNPGTIDPAQLYRR